MKNETNKLMRDQMIQKVRSSSARPRTRARAPRLHARKHVSRMQTRCSLHAHAHTCRSLGLALSLLDHTLLTAEFCCVCLGSR